MRPYTGYNPITGRVAVAVPIALPAPIGLTVVVEAAWGDTSDAGGARVRLDPTPASRRERAAACALAEPRMALLAARAAAREDGRMAERWRRGCGLVHRYGEMLRAGDGEARRDAQEGRRVTA